jgi:type IV pilus assembly protein PilM
MSHSITGIDIGAHAVKFVVVDVGFRQAHVTSTFEERVPRGEAPLPERQALALAAGLARLPPEQTLYTAVPGELLTIRVLDLPFSDARKVDQVVPFELEGQIVHALDDVVFDYVTVGAQGEGVSVLAVAAPIEELSSHLAELTGQGVEPRALFAAPVVYQALAGRDAAEEGTVPAAKLLLDVGHLRTNVAVLVDGKTVFARTIKRGGAALTAAIARALQCDEARAEALKHEHGFLASDARPARTQAEAQMDALLREELVPFLREIRQTLASVRARGKAPVEAVWLTGGGAALRGLPEYLAAELELPVSIWTPAEASKEERAPAADPSEGEPGGAPLASAIAWRGARGEREIDLRRGPFVFKASFSALRQKATHLAALAAALLLSITLDATMKMTRLSSEEEKLQAELKAATQELFGTPRTDGREVARELKRSFKDEMAPIPTASAFDILNEISRRMPGSDIKLDISDLDIKPKKIFIKGTVASVAARDEIVSRLREWTDCFEEIKPGSIQEVSGGKLFTLTIDSKCP